MKKITFSSIIIIGIFFFAPSTRISVLFSEASQIYKMKSNPEKSVWNY
ncbi:hypothetical protein LCGC14_0957260 [marine sediment metagenome]|uniref:Uncharacterized protein n=1 Tax=marine sediment metagenome TaxID=412755 RepID=A0A0F9RM09_9ZZZZ